MGLWGFIKALLGFEEGPKKPIYNPPFIVYPRARSAYLEHNDDYWERMRAAWRKRMDEVREKRSKYGGF